MADANPNIVFYLSRGNPYNAPVGMGTDQQVFGKSIGGRIFTEESLLTGQVIQTSLKNGSYDLFDPIVASDLVKNEVNYRVVYIFNPSINHIVLDNISVDTLRSPYLDFDICDADIATEGFFTLGELNRAVPAKPGTAGNPSIYLDDEYDSTNKLGGLIFKKTLDGTDLPVDIPTNCALKIWIRRKCALPKAQIPDGEFYEGIQLTVNEYNNEFSTPWAFNYIKQDGRIPLANWYDYTITPGIGNSIVMKELLPKELDLTTINLIKTFVKDDKVLIFYFTQLGITKNYHLLVVEPHDNVKKNKYIHVQFTFQSNVDDTETLASKDIVNIFKSYYDPAKYYIFWKDVIQVNTTTQQFFGLETTFDRISVDELATFIWTDKASFDAIAPGYDFRRMITYNTTNNKVVRNYTQIVNVEQFDDLFIMFAKDTHNAQILDIPGVKINRNQLLYLFEKDIISNKNNKFNTFPGDGAQVLSHRLYPQSLPKLNQISSYNNVKNKNIALIISDNGNVDTKNTASLRTIKTLLDGTRYIDFNSAHLREYKIQNSFVTHELPSQDTDLTSLIATTSFAITNDTNIYEELKPVHLLNNIMPNVVGTQVFPKPWFQQNIIDATGLGSQSIPTEWTDRTYKDVWITILSSAPVNGNTIYKIEYNFARNLWRAEWTDADGVVYTEIYNNLFGEQGTVSTSGTSGTPVTSGSSGNPGLISTGKPYGDLVIQDMPYVLEPDTYQPYTIKLSTVQVFSMSGSPKYKVNVKMYFKGNTTPIVEFATTTTDITSLSYVFVNVNKTFNMRMNYFEVADAKVYPTDYIVKNLHKALLNNLTISFSDEFKTNVQLTPRQADFRYYRKVSISGLEDIPFINDKSVVIPIVLYGNGYKKTNDILIDKISVQFPFDFKKLAINDKSLRFYFDSSFDTPLPFKVAHYDYEDEYAVVWVRLSNWTGTNKNLFMYYGKINISDTKTNVRTQYVSLKSNLYDTFVLGAWFLDNIFFDERLSFTDGKIYNMGEPVIYEKSSDTLSLTRIDKEYMYGIAKVYKSNKFVLEMDAPAEESLLFDPAVKDDFVKFIKDVATIFKPSYTEINDVRQFGFDVLEAGEGNMGETTNKRVAGLVATTPNANVMTYYDRVSDNKFNLLTSFNGYSKSIDWVIAKPVDTPIFKSGVMKINGKLKSETIKFDTPFKNTDYFIFLSSPVNQKLYWQLLCNNRFTVTASHYLLKEVSWMAFHRDIFGGVFTPNSIFVGKRDLTGSVETSGGPPTVANLPYWYNNELLVRPEVGVAGDPGTMVINPTDPGYSILLSSNENINTYWDGKETNQFRVKTSSPETCTIHWLVIRNGVEWWQEIVT